MAADLKTQRFEKDSLGEKAVPVDAYYGIQTLRAKENFKISGISVGCFPLFVKSLAMVKQAAARANSKLGLLDAPIATAIDQACSEVIAGRFDSEFIVDVIQGGAGTSTNMNANEVIANRALEILGHNKGEYQFLHPNNHVNLSQSTNDVYPTSIRLCILLSHSKLVGGLSALSYVLKQKAVEFSGVIKMGRTQLQDAVPMTLGQEFDAYCSTVKEDIDQIKNVASFFREINLGGTAIGTGINTEPEYSGLVIDELSRISGQSLVQTSDLIEATSDMGAFISLSGVLKRNAIKLSKICNDLRLMSSGPRTGFNEIDLPAVQPGSSIMPGKVNPVIPEMVNQVAYQICGNDLTISFAAEAGQLQLNVMEPIIAYKVLESFDLMSNAVNALADKCIKGITANEERCKDLVYNSISIVTALNPYLGYETSTRIAKEAFEKDINVVDIVQREGLIDLETLKEILKPENMTSARRTLKV